MSFANLKKNSATRLQELNKQLEDAKKSGGQQQDSDDSTYWKPTVSDEGNGFAIIRFLPEPNNEDLAWVKYWDHGFQGSGGWYIEKSLTTLGSKDPVSELNSRLWATGLQGDKQIVQGVNGKNATKRRLHFVSNIYVVSDPKAPQNEGKVFKYSYGKKIFDKIENAMNPNEEVDPDKEAINPFDFDTGANFRLKIRKVEGQRNYDSSEFDKPSALFDGDEAKQEAVWTQAHSLKEVIDPKHFKTYEKLQERLVKVMGDFVGSGIAVVEGTVEKSDPVPKTEPKKERQIARKEAPKPEVESEDESDADFFRKAAAGNL